MITEVATATGRGRWFATPALVVAGPVKVACGVWGLVAAVVGRLRSRSEDTPCAC